MKHEKKPEDLAAEQWLEELLNPQPAGDEIGADHQAMDAVGLQRAADLDPEWIMSESQPPVEASPEASPVVPAFEPAGSLAPPEAFYDDEFREAFGEGMALAQIIDEVNREAASPSSENTQYFIGTTETVSPAIIPMDEPSAPMPVPVDVAPVAVTKPSPERRRPPQKGKSRKGSTGRTPPARKPVSTPPVAPPPVVPPLPDITEAEGTAAETARRSAAEKAKDTAPAKKRRSSEPGETKEERSPKRKATSTSREDNSKKGRPKRKKGYGLFGLPHIVSTAIWLALILIIGVTAGRMIWLCATDVLAFGRDPITATVVVEKEDTIEDIAVKLQDAGLIRFTGLFELYADLTGAKDEILPGTYEFNAADGDEELVVYDYMALVSVMSPSSGLTVVDDLRIPEGYTCAQIFQLLEDNNVCTVEELEEYCISGELDDYWFLEGVERGDKYCLEGYLFPNTYDFYENDDPERVLEKMLDAFDANFTDQMRDDLNVLNDQLEVMLSANGYDSAYIQEHRITIREVVIIASMIEKESANSVESFTIASVIYNRLTNAAAFPYLNIDATLVYALDGKADLTEEDKKLDSPYNTYTNKGLPPGPICNPSQLNLAAALQPEQTDYYYYAYNPATEEHQFSATYEEHLLFLESLKNQENTQPTEAESEDE